jgi:hypothetical protein
VDGVLQLQTKRLSQSAGGAMVCAPTYR